MPLIFAAVLALSDPCHAWAELVEALEHVEPDRREDTIAAWRQVAGRDNRLLQLILRADAHIRAGMTASQAWRECPSI